jgi:hypothetical protein
MRLWRIEFGKVIGAPDWAVERPSCGCTLITTGHYFATWLAGYCWPIDESNIAALDSPDAD